MELCGVQATGLFTLFKLANYQTFISQKTLIV